MEDFKNPLCVFRCSLWLFSPKQRPGVFELKQLREPTIHENEKDARRNMIAIRLINASATLKHMVGRFMDMCG